MTTAEVAASFQSGERSAKSRLRAVWTIVSQPVLLIALGLTAALTIWGFVDAQGLAATSNTIVKFQFHARAWFIMLTVSMLLIACLWLPFSRFGRVRLGADDSEPDFSVFAWLSMLFAAGMGVGLLFFGTAEPLTHFMVAKERFPDDVAATEALTLTNFHWGLHAWAIYAMTGLVIAYFVHRRGLPMLLSSVVKATLNDGLATRLFGKTIDVLAITSISIGLGGSIALGVFQVQDGLTTLGWEIQGLHGAMVILAAITATFILPLTSGLNKGMARLSDAAMLIAILTMMYVLLVGPTPYIMSAMTDQIGRYITQVFHQGFRTYTFFDATQTNWFETWTLTYMVWWLAWSPFVGVFIARISRGRTVREYLAGVILAPTGFSIAWFATFGAASFYKVLAGRDELTTTALEAPGRTTFVMLEGLPFSEFTKFAVIIAAFLFVVTSVVSASYVLSMFSLKGSLRPPTAVKVTWGLVLGALGAVMIASGSVEAVRSVIALGAIPFVFIIVFLVVGLLRAIRLEPRV